MDKVTPNSTVRVVMVIEFDGGRFHGWQRQNNAYTVQQALEEALAAIEGTESNPSFSASGRTDTGVHATHMLVHADVIQSKWEKSREAYVKGMNFHLRGKGVCIHGVQQVRDEFHARYDCFERRYQYKIFNREFPSVIHGGYSWWISQPLDIDLMNKAGAMILGERDFTTFRASGCQSESTHRNLKVLKASKDANMITIDVQADAFLYHMVRNLVGTLVMIGSGKWKPEMMLLLLEQKDRSKAGQTAPAQGLYFTDALYPEWSAQQISGKVG